MAKSGDPNLKCSFCGKTQEAVEKLIAGPGVYICSDCVSACSELLKDYIENDIPRKPFCDGLVYEVIGIVEDILREKEVLQMIQ